MLNASDWEDASCSVDHIYYDNKTAFHGGPYIPLVENECAAIWPIIWQPFTDPPYSPDGIPQSAWFECTGCNKFDFHYYLGDDTCNKEFADAITSVDLGDDGYTCLDVEFTEIESSEGACVPTADFPEAICSRSFEYSSAIKCECDSIPPIDCSLCGLGTECLPDGTCVGNCFPDDNNCCSPHSCFDEGYDYFGNDFDPPIFSPVNTPGDCQENCRLEPGCKFWTYLADVAPDINLCFLKTSDEGRKLTPGLSVVSGPKEGCVDLCPNITPCLCEIDEWCCTVSFDSQCVSEAQDICGLKCQ